MNCYLCESEHQGTLRYGIQLAVGICQGCGVGVCLEHSRKADRPGAPLLCAGCAALKQVTAASTPVSVPMLKKETADVTQ